MSSNPTERASDAGRAGESPPETKTVPLNASDQPVTDTRGGANAAASTVPGQLPYRLGRYLLVRLLGRGGMGAVYLAEHEIMERQVALKVISRAITEKPELAERFRREIKAVAKLTHPNIVAAHDAEQIGDTHLLVMEYVDGSDLAKLVAQRGKLPIADACNYVRQAALGLQHAHQHGLIHRDIKPHNLMLTRSGRVKVLDFGLARIGRAAAETASEGITASNVIMGTPDYMAPEQTSSAHAVDIRADVYSLGCTLYHLLTGQVPFPGGTVIDKLMKHNTERPEQVEQLRPDVPHELARVVRRMMAKEPDRRFQTPAEVAEALAEFASPAPDEASTAQTALVSGRHPSTGASAAEGEESAAAVQNRRAIWAAIAVAVVLVMAAVGMVIYLSVFMNRAGQPIALEPTRANAAANRPPNPGNFLDKEGPALKEIRQFKGHTGAVSSVSVSPSGELLLTGGQDATVRLWEIATGRQVRQFKGHTDLVLVVVFSPDGKQALSGGGDKTLRLWDVATGNEVRRFEGHTDAIAGIAFLPDGKSAVTAGDDQTYRLWDLATGETIRKMEEPPGEGYRFGKIAVSPDGKQLAAGGKDNVLRLWNLETGELERPVATKHNGPVTGVAYYADDLVQGIVSGARNDTVLRFWLFRIRNQSVFLNHTTTGIASIAASTVKRAAVAGGGDGSLSLCSIIDGRELGHAAAHQGPVFGVAFTPDGKQLVSCGKDGTVRLWEVP